MKSLKYYAIRALPKEAYKTPELKAFADLEEMRPLFRKYVSVENQVIMCGLGVEYLEHSGLLVKDNNDGTITYKEIEYNAGKIELLQSFTVSMDGAYHGEKYYKCTYGYVYRENYKNGLLHGRCDTFNHMGEQIESFNYREGEPIGTFHTENFYIPGIDIYINARGRYSKNKIRIRVIENGTLTIAVIRRGKVDTLEKFKSYKNNKLCRFITNNQGMLIDTVINDDITHVWKYKGGDKINMTGSYHKYSQGELVEMKSYKDGKFHGMVKTVSNGIVQVESYKRGVLHGPARKYRDGKKIEDRLYIAGKVTGRELLTAS